MKNTNTFLLITTAIILLQSCTRVMYVPNMQNTPLLKEKNEVRATLATSNYQIAYGVTDGLGVMLNGYSQNHEGSFALSTAKASKRKFTEIGVGYFKPLNNLAVFEVYTGAGIGKVEFDKHEYQNQGRFSACFKRYFIQTNFGVSIDFIDLTVSLRYSHLSFYDLNTSRYTYSGNVNSTSNLANIDKHSYGFIEPAVTMRAGWKYVKLQFQIQRIAQIYSPKINYMDVEYNIGIHFNIARRFNGEEKRIREI